MSTQILDIYQGNKFDADQELKKWMQQNNIRVLNVAGPRAFKEPEVAQFVISTLGHAFKQVADLGDEAWQESDTIFVRTGTLWFSLHLVKLDGAPDDQANMAALAKTILGRIGK